MRLQGVLLAGSCVRLLHPSLAPAFRELWCCPVTHGQRFGRSTQLRHLAVSVRFIGPAEKPYVDGRMSGTGRDTSLPLGWRSCGTLWRDTRPTSLLALQVLCCLATSMRVVKKGVPVSAVSSDRSVRATVSPSSSRCSSSLQAHIIHWELSYLVLQD